MLNVETAVERALPALDDGAPPLLPLIAECDRPLRHACVECGAPCRFALCDRCLERAPFGETETTEPVYPIDDDVLGGVGLPVSHDGVRRFS